MTLFVCLKTMELIHILEKTEFRTALATLQWQGIAHDPDQRGEPVIWLHNQTDVEPALKRLRAEGIRAAHKPWH